MPRLLLLFLLAALALPAAAQSSDRQRNTVEAVKPADTPPAQLGAIVGDGSFEAGSPSPVWDEGSATFGTALCTVAFCGLGAGTGPRTGDWWLWFGGTSGGDTGWGRQEVTIPAGSATLKFWLQIPLVTDGTGYTAVHMGPTEVFRATYAADQPTYGSYTEVSVDVSAFAGGTVMLEFESVTTGSGNFFIDDVSIEAVPAGPSLSVSRSSINFGGVQVGSTSPDESVTLTNNGSSALTISSFDLTGIPAGFALTAPSTPLVLNVGQSTGIVLTFTPATTGPASGSLSITHDAPTSPTTVALSGNGTDFTTIPSTDTPIAVPDGAPGGTVCGDPGAPAVSTISVSGVPGTVLDLDLLIDISSTWIGDVEATLSHGATSAIVIDNPGAATPTACGNSTDNFPGIILDDAAANSVQTGPFPLVAGGSYAPAFPLSAFNGDEINGAWALSVTDGGEGDPTTLNSWALIITPSGTIATEEGPNGVSELRVAPNPVSTQGQAMLRVASSQDVRVALYDALGREVRVVLDRALTAGQEAHIAFRTDDLPAGVYVLRATGTDVSLTERVTVVR